jgi:hypothetical protein
LIRALQRRHPKPLAAWWVTLLGFVPLACGTSHDGSVGPGAAGNAGATATPSSGGAATSAFGGAGGATAAAGGSGGLLATAGAPESGGATGAAGGGATGSGGTAGVGGNGGAGGGTDATLASRCQSGAALCDDFETVSSGAAPDPAKWKVLTSYSGQPSSVNSVIVDAAQHARGAQALHVHTETGDPVYIETAALPGSGNHFFVRAFAWFEVDPGARTKGHWGGIVGVGPKAGASQDVEVRFGGQFDILVVNYSPNDALQISSSRDGFYDDGTRLPVQKWTCFEVELDGDGDELRVFMDDTELDRLHVTNWGQFGHQPTVGWSPKYDKVRIGYQSWNADTPVDVWYDAIVVDTMRVGCSR